MSIQENHASSREKPHKALAVGVSLILWLICVTYIYPFIWMLYNSFKDEGAYRANPYNLPWPPTLFTYTQIFRRGDVYTAFFNSTFNTTISILGVVVLAFIMAYFLARYRFRGRAFLYAFFLTGLLVPGLGLLIPGYIQFHFLKMMNHRYTLLIPYITFSLPTAMYLYDSYIRTIPRSLEEAAFIDGAKTLDMIRLIIFPICLPMTATIVVINFLGHWNEFAFALVLAPDPRFRTLPVWLSTFQTQYTSNQTGRLTAMLIITVPVIITYLLFKEQMIRGLSAGAVKG